MRVGEPRQGCTPTGGCWCSLDFCPRNEKPRKREIYTTDSHPTLFEIDNSGIRICLTERFDTNKPWLINKMNNVRDCGFCSCFLAAIPGDTSGKTVAWMNWMDVVVTRI